MMGLYLFIKHGQRHQSLEKGSVEKVDVGIALLRSGELTITVSCGKTFLRACFSANVDTHAFIYCAAMV